MRIININVNKEHNELIKGANKKESHKIFNEILRRGLIKRGYLV